MDLYVARKRSHLRVSFGFIRFIKVGNLQELESRMNTMSFEGKKLHANVAIFKRNKILVQSGHIDHAYTDDRRWKKLL